MKIAILDIDDLKNPHWGSGQSKVTREVFKRLSKENEIVVYASKYPNYKDYKEDGIMYKHIGLGTNNSKLNNLFYIFATPFITLTIKADVILENFTAPISTLFTPLLTKTPVIGITSFFSSGDKTSQYKVPFDKVERIGLRYYKYIIALNNDYFKKINKINKKIEVEIIPNGIDDVYFQTKTKEKDYILFLGRIDINQKGLDLLIRAYSLISNKLDEDLYIVGYGSKENEDALKQLISESGSENKIKFLGKKVGREKQILQAESKVIAFPSRFEGQSLSALEAIALGKPIICFDIAGFSWLPESACIKAKSFDEKDYAKKLLNLLKDKKSLKRISKNAKKESLKYTWNNSASLYSKFIARVIQ